MLHALQGHAKGKIVKVSLIQRAEADNAVKVLVFKSADPDYFISHVDVTKIKEYREEAAKLSANRRSVFCFAI